MAPIRVFMRLVCLKQTAGILVLVRDRVAGKPQRGRCWVKVGGPNDRKWAVILYESYIKLSKNLKWIALKVDGPKIKA